MFSWLSYILTSPGADEFIGTWPYGSLPEKIIFGPHLVGPECHLPAASGAAPDVAVVADVADAVGKLGLEADLAGGVQFDSGLPLHFRFLPDLLLQIEHFLLLHPEMIISGLKVLLGHTTQLVQFIDHNN